MERLEKCPLEFVNLQHRQIKDKVNIWFRLKEEQEKSYDFEDDEKSAFIEWIDLKISDESDESIVSDLESVKEEMNAWE